MLFRPSHFSAEPPPYDPRNTCHARRQFLSDGRHAGLAGIIFGFAGELPVGDSFAGAGLGEVGTYPVDRCIGGADRLESDASSSDLASGLKLNSLVSEPGDRAFPRIKLKLIFGEVGGLSAGGSANLTVFLLLVRRFEVEADDSAFEIATVAGFGDSEVESGGGPGLNDTLSMTSLGDRFELSTGGNPATSAVEADVAEEPGFDVDDRLDWLEFDGGRSSILVGASTSMLACQHTVYSLLGKMDENYMMTIDCNVNAYG